MALSNVQFSEMDGTTRQGNSGKSDAACLHEHVSEQPACFQPFCRLPSAEGERITAREGQDCAKWHRLKKGPGFLIPL